MANQADGELKRILVALREVTAGKVEDNTVDYMAGMLQEEGVATLNGESAAELIGDFLVDAAVAQDSADAEVICERLLHMLQATDGARVDRSAGKSKRTETARDFVTPLKMADVAGDTDNNSFSDPYLGLNADSSRVNYNTPVLGGAAGEAKAAAAAAEQQQRLQQQRERHLRALKEWEKNKPPLPPLKRRHGDKQLKKLGEGIIVDRFSLSVAGRELLTDAQLKLMKGRRYGLAGRNGIGKSTLLNALARHEIQGVNFGFSIGMVEQEHVWGTETALESVLAVDDDRTQLLAEEKLLLSQNDKSEKVGRRLATIYERLEEIDAANAESVAATILSGLGFTEAMQHAQVTTLSGGWRMRVLLARCLFSDADVLLLDEPTNHLDLEAVQWLTSYLALKPDAAAAASTPGVAASSAASSSLSSSSSCASSSASATAAGAGKERGKGKAAAAATGGGGGGGGGGAAAGPGARAGGAARPTAAAPMRCARDKIVVVVSHAREFLNDVCTDMIHFANQSLSYYRGNYDTFEAVRASQLQQQQRQADAQQQKVKHMQSFIDKFRYNAKRASLVQSRIKLLNKLPLLDVVAADPTLQFQFHVPEPLGAPLLQAEGVYFKYERKREEEGKATAFGVAAAEEEEEQEAQQADDEEEDATAAAGSEGGGGDAGGHDGEGEGRGEEGGEEGKNTKKGRGVPCGADPRSSNHCVPTSLTKKTFDEPGEKFVVKNMNFSVDMDSRIALCGVNGSGKSTVLKLLVGKEKPHAGVIHQNGKLRIGYFTQQHVDQLDLTLNAVHSLQTKYPEANLKDEEARAWLSQFGITGLLALEPLYILSGGQKSRVAIALMAFNNPHILLLDEPTNHLDLDAVQALMAALNNFKGGVVIVSHDSHLLSCVVEEIYYMDEKNQTLCKFKGDFPEYKKQLLKSRRVGLNN